MKRSFLSKLFGKKEEVVDKPIIKPIVDKVKVDFDEISPKKILITDSYKIGVDGIEVPKETKYKVKKVKVTKSKNEILQSVRRRAAELNIPLQFNKNTLLGVDMLHHKAYGDLDEWLKPSDNKAQLKRFRKWITDTLKENGYSGEYIGMTWEWKL